jgi:NADPH:quinone reductase-like Zn-dependent oxidoreductase
LSHYQVLNNGASGRVDTFAVQIAKSFGAGVIGACSTRNVDMVRSPGADHVIDYTKEDFTENGRRYDLIFETVGKSSVTRGKRSLKQDGVYLANVIGPPVLLQMLWTSVIGSKKVKGGIAGEKTEDLIFLRELIEAGEIKPVVDRRYPLEQIAEAHRYVETGHKKGNVIITVEHSIE